jgi:hypothetical protein
LSASPARLSFGIAASIIRLPNAKPTLKSHRSSIGEQT